MPSLFQRYNMSKTCQLFSGSSGNSIFISSGETRILIDAGVTAKRIDEGLSAIGESADRINAIFSTYENGGQHASERCENPSGMPAGAGGGYRLRLSGRYDPERV